MFVHIDEFAMSAAVESSLDPKKQLVVHVYPDSLSIGIASKGRLGASEKLTFSADNACYGAVRSFAESLIDFRPANDICDDFNSSYLRVWFGREQVSFEFLCDSNQLSHAGKVELRSSLRNDGLSIACKSFVSDVKRQCDKIDFVDQADEALSNDEIVS